jgi:serine/threonine protein kinase
MTASSSGQTIAHYEILEELGRGGMGVVYKAKDIRLERTVALKMLPDHLSGDDEAKARFLHEGRAASALDHPSICTIFDVGESDDGRLFMAMAYVDGPSLSDLIAERPLELDRALEIAIDVGEGLQHSHDSGVVHRDIKPSNVMLTSSGYVKVLDFGLARLAGATILTASGTTLGTAAYMSPEQAQGQRADARADIWALGVILYEMITGVRPFAGEYQQALTYAIINEQPEPLTALRTGVPLELDRIVDKALAKNPAERYQHIVELLVDLRNARKRLSDNSDGSGTRQRPTGRAGLVMLVAAVTLASIAIVVGILSWPRDPTATVIKAMIETDGIPVHSHLVAPPLAVSPDGSRLVYVRETGSSSILVIRSLNSFVESPIDGTEGGHSPFFSPDGKWIGFLTETELKKTSLESGYTLTVARVPSWVNGADWGSDGMIVVGSPEGLAKVPSDGGKLELFAPSDIESNNDRWLVSPEFLPGNDYAIVTSVNSVGGNPKIWAVSMSDGEKSFLLEGGRATYVEPGYLVVPRGDALWIVRFDAETRKVTSTPIVALEGVLAGSQDQSLALYDVSDSGVLAFVPGQVNLGNLSLAWVGENEEITQISNETGSYMGVNLSPNGRRIVTTRPEDTGVRQVRVFDLDRQMWISLTSGTDNWWPGWAPDGETIYMTHGVAPSQFNLASQRVGSRQMSVVTDDSFIYQIRSWIPATGEALLQRNSSLSDPAFDIARFRPGSGSDPEPFIDGPMHEIHPAVSPNGMWLAYALSRDEDLYLNELPFDVYVRGLHEAEPLIQISTGGGFAPVWSRDGTRLYYESLDGLMVINWPDPEVLSPGVPRIFYSGSFARSIEYGINYDAGLDDRLLILLRDENVRNVRIVTGWTSEIERMLTR